MTTRRSTPPTETTESSAPNSIKEGRRLRSNLKSSNFETEPGTDRKSVRFVDEEKGKELAVICFTEEDEDLPHRKKSKSCCTIS